MLARNGLPIGMVRMMMNGGLKSDVDTSQEALVNWMVSSGMATMESAPMMVERMYNVELDGDMNAFYVSQLLDQGKIEPFMGFLILARSQKLSSAEIRNVFRAINFGNQSMLQSWSHGFKYVPNDLPTKVYPGARLQFAHLESLGVDTCSIIAPDLRQECGYKGISADQCEQKPYCCYNPILSDDAQYDDTPWCYYNLYGFGWN